MIQVKRSIARYSKEEKVWLKTAESFVKRRANFHGIDLYVLVENDPPYMIIDKNLTYEEPQVYLNIAERIPDEALGGAFATVLRGMAQELNFTYNLFRPYGLGKLGRWGSKLESNGTWTGMMGMMERRLFDFAAVPFSIKTSRAEAVDYVFPAGSYRLGLVIRDPVQEDFSWLTFANSFMPMSWLALLATSLFFTLFVQCKNISYLRRVYIC